MRIYSSTLSTLTEHQQGDGIRRRFTNTRSVTWEAEKPSDVSILHGAWWTKGTKEPVVSIEDEAAKTLEINVGAQIELSVSGRTIRARSHREPILAEKAVSNPLTPL